MTSSLKALAVYTLAVGAALYALFILLHWPFGMPQLAMLLFLALLTGVVHAWQEHALATDPKGFMFRFMAGLALKLVVAVVSIAALLLLLPRARSLPLALTFAGLYLLFLVFSAVQLSTRSRRAPRP
jgi:hypothetical protein